MSSSLGRKKKNSIYCSSQDIRSEQIIALWFLSTFCHYKSSKCSTNWSFAPMNFSHSHNDETKLKWNHFLLKTTSEPLPEKQKRWVLQAGWQCLGQAGRAGSIPLRGSQKPLWFIPLSQAAGDMGTRWAWCLFSWQAVRSQSGPAQEANKAIYSLSFFIAFGSIFQKQSDVSCLSLY